MNFRFIPQRGTVTTWALALCLCLTVGLSYKLDPELYFDGVAERAAIKAVEEGE